MKELYILIPLIRCNTNNLSFQIQKILNISSFDYQIHEIQQTKYAIQIHQNKLGYKQLEQILKEYQNLKNKIDMIESALRQSDWNSKDISFQNNHSIDSLMKKAIKYKQIKQENKKLKKLLQNQLQNTEKVREQTQKTMKILRQQFDSLVKEMGKQTKQKQKTKNSNLFFNKQIKN